MWFSSSRLGPGLNSSAKFCMGTLQEQHLSERLSHAGVKRHPPVNSNLSRLDAHCCRHLVHSLLG